MEMENGITDEVDVTGTHVSSCIVFAHECLEKCLGYMTLRKWRREGAVKSKKWVRDCQRLLPDNLSQPISAYFHP